MTAIVEAMRWYPPETGDYSYWYHLGVLDLYHSKPPKPADDFAKGPEYPTGE